MCRTIATIASLVLLATTARAGDYQSGFGFGISVPDVWLVLTQGEVAKNASLFLDGEGGESMGSVPPEMRRAVFERIQGGELSPGDLMPSERELMQVYNVGRPAIREAMQSLQTNGLVVIRHGGRARVAEPSLSGMIDQLSETMLVRISPAWVTPIAFGVAGKLAEGTGSPSPIGRAWTPIYPSSVMPSMPNFGFSMRPVRLRPPSTKYSSGTPRATSWPT